MTDDELVDILAGADEIAVSLGDRVLSTGMTVSETLAGLTAIIAGLSRQLVPGAAGGAADFPASEGARGARCAPRSWRGRRPRRR